MTWTGRILGSLLALVVVSGAAQGQPGTAPPAQGQPGTAPSAQGQPGTAPAAQGQPGTAPPVQVSEVTVDSTKITTIQIKTSGAAKYHARLFAKPPRLVIDLDDTLNAVAQTPATPGADPIKQIRASQFKPDVTRVVIEFTRKVAYRIRATPNGITVTLSPPAPPVAAQGAAPAPPAPLAAAQGAAPTPPAPPGQLPAPAAPEVAKVEKPASPKPAAAAPKVAAAQAPKPGVKAEAALPPAPEIAQAPAPAPAPGPAPAGPKLISLDFKDADVVNLLRILAAESGKNIVIGDDVKGKMSITLRNVPWETALETILEARGLQKIERENLIRIVSSEQLSREREAAARLEEAKAKAEADVRQKIADAKKAEQAVAATEAAQQEALARGPLREETIRLSYADPLDVTKTLQGILGIPPQGIQASPLTPGIAPGPGGPPPIAQPPFSALYGTAPPPSPGPASSPSAEVLSRGITIQANPATNAVFIRHYARDLERIKKLIRETLDIPLPQVKIEARLEEIQRAALEAIGVSWGGGGATTVGNRVAFVGQGVPTDVGGGTSAAGSVTPASPAIGVQGVRPSNNGLNLSSILPVSPTTGLPTGGSLVNLLPLSSLGAFGSPSLGLGFGIIDSKFNIDLALQALQTESKTRTLSRPEIVMVENKEATIALGEQIPYATVSSAGTQIQFVSALLQLTVRPHVILERDGTKVKLRVVVDNNQRGDPVNLGGSGSPPAINTEHAETEVLIKEGERLVIGGVGKTSDIDSLRKVPLFADIPLLGWLFKAKGTDQSSRELVVFITPSVLRTTPPTQAPAQ